MTNEEAIDELKLLRESAVPWQVPHLLEAIDMAIEALTDRLQGEWIFNPTDAIDLMFAKPKCSRCGFESSDGGNFCPNCGAEMMTKESAE